MQKKTKHAMLSEGKITEIYCMADDFCKFFNETVKKHTLQVSDGKRHRDKGYISKELFHELFVDGIQLITKVRNNMKNCLMSVSDKVLLRKRAVIESVNDELKNIAQLEHSRHRSFNNFIVNAVSALAAYCFFPKKPAISLEYLRRPEPSSGRRSRS